MTYYEFLNVPVNATLREIKEAYRKLTLKYHPDKGGSHEMFIKLQKAYSILVDPSRKIDLR
jgi:curved DNA-binding protein CbpA